MGFRKDRNSNATEETTDHVEKIIETAKEVFPEVKEIVIETKTEAEIQPVIPEKKEAPKKAAKKVEKIVKTRKSNKPSIAAGLAGDTTEIRDFKAIVKRKGMQINVVLTDILKAWNQANYTF